tara:strand:+ start:349 stop:465 length:117 start_codon:yes stop_codon:yes gene_type:complete
MTGKDATFHLYKDLTAEPSEIARHNGVVWADLAKRQVS